MHIRDECQVPDSNVYLELTNHDSVYCLKIIGDSQGLMSTHTTESEEQLAFHGCRHLAGNPEARVLVGGLGMGFTLAAVLQTVDEQATVVVSELVPEVVEWNRGLLAHLAGWPLEDPRVEVHVGSVELLIKNTKYQWDAILLDCDNGPEALVHPNNDWLYSLQGLVAAYNRLSSNGVLALWAAKIYPNFLSQLSFAGFIAEIVELNNSILYIGRKAEC